MGVWCLVRTSWRSMRPKSLRRTGGGSTFTPPLTLSTQLRPRPFRTEASDGTRRGAGDVRRRKRSGSISTRLCQRAWDAAKGACNAISDATVNRTRFSRSAKTGIRRASWGNLDVRLAAIRLAIGLAFLSSSPGLPAAAVRTARQGPEKLQVRLSGDREIPSWVATTITTSGVMFRLLRRRPPPPP